MTDNEKNGNFGLVIIGIAAMFFAYLIYIKSKETPQIQPIQPIQLPQQTQLDSVELYKISEKLQLQSDQIQLIQDQQIKQMQDISLIESTKCSNVVSMNDGTYPSMNNGTYPSIKTNVRRENEEDIANRIFGMK